MREQFRMTDLFIPLFQIICLLGAAISLFQYLDEGRLPTYAYLAFGLVQLFPIILNFTRRNFLTAVFGICLTGILLLATAIEYTPEPNFDAVMTATSYTPNLIERAYHALLFASSIFHLLTVKLIPKQSWVWTPPDEIEQQFARKAIMIFLPVGILFTYLTVRGSSITEAAYASPEYNLSSGLVGSAGIELLSMFLLVFTLVSAVRAWGYESRNFKLTALLVIAVVIYFRVLRGDRAASLGAFTTLALIYYIYSRHTKIAKGVLLTSTAGLLYLFYELWGYVRANAALEGFTTAVVNGLHNGIVEKLFGSEFEPGFNPLNITLLPQSYWHLLHTIDLYDSGISLDGTSFIDLIPQSIPGVVSDLIGFERPLNGAWRLAEYRVHGGGMYIVAEGFWNYGLLGAGVIALMLAGMAILLENWHRRQEPLLYCTYFAFLGTFGFGVFYGLQSLVKAFEVAFVISLLMSYALRRYRLHKMKIVNHRDTEIARSRWVQARS